MAGRVVRRGGPYPKPGRKSRSRAATSRAQVEQARPDVLERDGHQCVVAGSWWAREWPCAGPLTMQHAAGKGMGGSALYDDPVLLRTMCNWHNTLAEVNAAFGRLCQWLGWSLSRSRVDARTIDPQTVPVRYPDGRDYLLGPGLAREPITAEHAADLRVTLYGADADPTMNERTDLGRRAQ